MKPGWIGPATAGAAIPSAAQAITVIIAMPEFGQLDNKQVASLAGLAPVARDG